jgi:hypothetical protein
MLPSLLTVTILALSCLEQTHATKGNMRCTNGYLEKCDHVDFTICKDSDWKPANASEYEEFQKKMEEGAKKLEETSKKLPGGGEEMKKGAEKMRKEARECKLRDGSASPQASSSASAGDPKASASATSSAPNLPLTLISVVAVSVDYVRKLY